MNLLKFPPALVPGNRLIAVLPSGALSELEAFEAGVAVWLSRGYEVVLPPDLRVRRGYLAGADLVRRSQLEQALSDPACHAILCVRGGYGGARLLEDWHWPEAEPRWLVGFSDITALLWAQAVRGRAGLHGPLLTTLGREPHWSIDRLFDAVEGRALAPLNGQGWGNGRAQGLLLPANLTVATHLLGTALCPDLTGTILAFEDVGEQPYRLDRMLTQWRMCGAFAGVRGIALGRFSQCEPLHPERSLSVVEVLQDRLGDLGLPIVSELPFGHDGVNAALPVGCPVVLDGDAGVLAFEP
ncbi:LD-carboxypeptidase [Leptolyngbya sp. FACHB-261]|uniref:S66 peptidase family protein n=1 Tax=Leptolyngbya sp. FACHB-261 TaxID=2692806 RepID=UPI001684B2CD|nr:LD-carboxypeptidase [Leptolyngbya sp. FACHB-261]MBD2099554.1 LD-carboxypeptidase [Leptolyngbya sp. FACHB-261]